MDVSAAATAVFFHAEPGGVASVLIGSTGE